MFSDRFGRKWPLVFNLALIAVLELGAGFVQTFRQFLALRSLFGIGMGGIWGLAASTALENLPAEARGLASGVLQQGYAVGYLLAAVINLTLVPETKAGWRSLFWTAAGISVFAAFVRAVLPESEVFLRAKAAEKARGTDTTKKTKIFLKETKEMLKRHWLLCIYAVLLMTGTLAVGSHISGRRLKMVSLFRIQLPLARFPGTRHTPRGRLLPPLGYKHDLATHSVASARTYIQPTSKCRRTFCRMMPQLRLSLGTA